MPPPDASPSRNHAWFLAQASRNSPSRTSHARTTVGVPPRQRARPRVAPEIATARDRARVRRRRTRLTAIVLLAALTLAAIYLVAGRPQAGLPGRGTRRDSGCRGAGRDAGGRESAVTDGPCGGRARRRHVRPVRDSGPDAGVLGRLLPYHVAVENGVGIAPRRVRRGGRRGPRGSPELDRRRRAVPAGAGRDGGELHDLPGDAGDVGGHVPGGVAGDRSVYILSPLYRQGRDQLGPMADRRAPTTAPLSARIRHT